MRRGALIEEMGQTWLAELDADGDEARTLRPLQAAAITYGIAFGLGTGHKVLTLRGAMARELLCSDIDGFGLLAAGQVELKLKTPWRDGPTHLLVSEYPCPPGAGSAAAAQGSGARGAAALRCLSRSR